MPNNDRQYGTFNKKTHIYRQTDVVGEDLTSPRVFANTSEAIDYFFPKLLQQIFDECCTTLQWVLINEKVATLQD